MPTLRTRHNEKEAKSEGTTKRGGKSEKSEGKASGRAVGGEGKSKEPEGRVMG